MGTFEENVRIYWVPGSRSHPGLSWSDYDKKIGKTSLRRARLLKVYGCLFVHIHHIHMFESQSKLHNHQHL
jgi:hypothetical protein